MAYVLEAVWDGSRPGLWTAGLAWAVLGALAVLLFYLAARRAFPAPVGVLTGLLCAGSTGLLVLSTSLNNETPYLVLLGRRLLADGGRAPRAAARAGRRLGRPQRGGLPRPGRARTVLRARARMASLGMAGPAPAGRRRAGARASGAPRGPRWPPSSAFGFVLLPWHLAIWGRLADFNTVPPESNAATERAQAAQEAALAHLELGGGRPRGARRPAGVHPAAGGQLRRRDGGPPAASRRAGG